MDNFKQIQIRSEWALRSSFKSSIFYLTPLICFITSNILIHISTFIYFRFMWIYLSIISDLFFLKFSHFFYLSRSSLILMVFFINYSWLIACMFFSMERYSEDFSTYLFLLINFRSLFIINLFYLFLELSLVVMVSSFTFIFSLLVKNTNSDGF